ncbi:hypothetical protein D3C87_1816360 [compost metagenome]
MLSVGQKWEGEAMFFDKSLMRFFTIRAYPEHLITLFQERSVVVPDVAGLIGAGRCVIFGIKVQNNFLSLQIRQLYLVSILIFY